MFNLKKTLALSGAFLAAFLVTALVPVYAQMTGGTLSLSPTSGTFNKGCSFSLEVKVDTGGAQTDGTDAIIFYDPTRFNAVKINNGTAYADYSGSNIDVKNGKITVSGLATGSTFSSSGTLATIDFKVLDAAPIGATQIKFDFDPNDKAKTIDSNIVEHGTVVDVLNQVQDGTYTIGSGVGCTDVPKGGPTGSTDSAIVFETQVPTKTIDDLTGNGKNSGSVETTIFFAITGTILTILGVIGLALL